MTNWIVSSSCLILIMIALRYFFQGKISARFQYALWILVAVRLLMPINLGSSILSVENFLNHQSFHFQQERSQEKQVVQTPIEQDEERVKIYDSITQIEHDESALNVQMEQEEKPEVLKPQTVPIASSKPIKKFDAAKLGLTIWMIGMGMFGAVFAGSNLHFHMRMKRSKRQIAFPDVKLPVYESAVIDTPCLFGFFRPAIYVTPNVAKDPQILRHAVCHEQSHYHQGDLFWAPIRCICLILHWYNPLVWWAVKVSKQDAELSCDEVTIRKLGEEERISYGKTLIQLTCEKRPEFFLTATTMTSGKQSITERIRRIVKTSSFKLYAFLGVLLVAIIGVGCTFTGAENEKKSEKAAVAPVCGTPCKDPKADGWNLENVTDVRENFSEICLTPVEENENNTYLLCEMENGNVLYGKGDHQTMLLRKEGKYAEIEFPYISNYCVLPQLMENDIDRDGQTEVMIWLYLQAGTGLHLENLLLADVNEEGEMYVYAFTWEECENLLLEELTCEITEAGIQPFVNGRLAGRMQPHLEDEEPFYGASVGNVLEFEFDHSSGEVILHGEIMFLLEDDPAGLYGNGNDVTATVQWDGKEFSLTNFTSKNSWMEIQIQDALQSQYDVESFYSIKMDYDSTKMNEDTLVVQVEFLMERTDSEETLATIYLKKSQKLTASGSWLNLSEYSGWVIDEIEIVSTSNATKIIDKANLNLRDGYVDAKLTYVDNAEVGWDYYSDNPWNSDTERDALAQAALKELYTLTGYNVTECTYTTDGRSRFIFGKDGDYIRRCIAFYSRDYGFTLCGDAVPYQGYMNARKFHYSDVQQLIGPLDGGVEEYEGGLSGWFLENSGVYCGEKIIAHEEINKDDTVYIHVKLLFDGGYYIVVIDKALSSCDEVLGPYYELEKDTSVESENTSGQMIINDKSYETVIQDEVYRQAMTDFLETGVYPATTGVQCDGDPFRAQYAVQDIDGDGREELLLSFPDAETIAGMTYCIYDYDRTTGKLYVQNSGYPDFTIYDNGYIKGEMSHNHGRSNLDDFWPYYLYYYNAEEDVYESIASVDAWQERDDIEQEPPFPKEKDLNGDGVVYYDNMAQTYDNPEGIMDNEEYEKWCAKYNQGNKIEIQWYLAGGTESTLSDDDSVYYEVPRNNQVCLAVMPDGISTAGGDYRYIIPENQEEWVKAYKEMYALSAGNGHWREDERSMGIWIVYNDVWTCLTDQGFLVNFSYRTESSDAQEFYNLCLNEAYKQGINEPVRPGEIKNLVSATLSLEDGMYLLTDEKSLFEIQKAFSSSQEIRGGAACPFSADLSLKTEEGAIKNISLATDSCDTWLSSGVYYQYFGFEDIEELRSYFKEHGTDISSVMATFRGDISVQNHEILGEKAFQWISWKDVSSVVGNDYREWISEEGANGRMVYRMVNGVTYILPEYYEGAEVNQIAGVLIKDKKYQLSNGLSVGMQESEIANIDMPFQRYEKDVNGKGLSDKNGGAISLYLGMDNPEIIAYDYAYSWDQGMVMDPEEQKELLRELGLPEERCSEVNFILAAFVKDEVVSGIFMGIIP